MTSTEYKVGFSGSEDRTSAKILKPPGGGTSDIFGQTSAQENSAKAAEYKTKNSGIGNPITGEGYKAEDIETEKVLHHPAVRVRNPPGGPSTKLW